MKNSIVLLLWSLTIPVVLAQKVTIDSPPGTDFSPYKTYAWAVLDKPPIIRVDSVSQGVLTDQQLDSRIHTLVDEQLARKGFHKTDEGQPDFLVSYLAAAVYDMTQRGIDAGAAGYGGRLPDGHWRPFYDRPDSNAYGLIRRGTLSIDILDAGTKALVWRGTARKNFKKPEQVAKELDKIVKKILKKFPPK